jgi:hypothetical protein
LDAEIDERAGEILSRPIPPEPVIMALEERIRDLREEDRIEEVTVILATIGRIVDEIDRHNARRRSLERGFHEARQGQNGGGSPVSPYLRSEGAA